MDAVLGAGLRSGSTGGGVEECVLRGGDVGRGLEQVLRGRGAHRYDQALFEAGVWAEAHVT